MSTPAPPASPITCDTNARARIRAAQSDNLESRHADAAPLREPREPALDPAGIYGVIPVNTRQQFDVREIIARIVDGSEFDDSGGYGATLVTGSRHRGTPSASSPQTGAVFRGRRSKARISSSCAASAAIPSLFLQKSTASWSQKIRGCGIAKDGAKMVMAVAARACRKFTVIIAAASAPATTACATCVRPRLP